MCARKYGMCVRKYCPLGHKTADLRNDVISSYKVTGFHITTPFMLYGTRYIVPYIPYPKFIRHMVCDGMVRSCSHLHYFVCRQDHNADEDAIIKIFTWSKTENLSEWPHDWTQFSADRIMTPRLLYKRNLVHGIIKIKAHDHLCICALSAGNFDNPYWWESARIYCLPPMCSMNHVQPNLCRYIHKY
jgi:hypothetical protein